MNESTLAIHMVNGGFILVTEGADSYGNPVNRTEVFTSQGRLIKAVRGALDRGSLIKKEKDVDDVVDA